MSNKDRELITRSENVRREQRTLKQKKMDRLLNVLIAIVVILIVINLFIIFSDQDDKEIAQQQTNENKIEEPIENSSLTKESQTTDTETKEVSQVEISPSDDPLVEELIIDASWQPTPTKQQGEHISSYVEGHVDYEEKIETFLNAVELTEEETIFWSVRNNGSTEKSKAVLSNRDKTKMYRVSIEWVDDEGWKPVTVERLKQLEGTYSN